MAASTYLSKQRTERRLAVRLPMQVTGRDSRGVIFTEETSSENLCPNGAAFLTRFEVAIGSDLDIRIPQSYQPWKRDELDFSTRGKLVHVPPSRRPAQRVRRASSPGPPFRTQFHAL